MAARLSLQVFSADARGINRNARAKSRRMVPTGDDLRRSQGLHTLYISPLKALAVDIARNLETPVREMGLPIRIETRTTADTPTSKRQRQRRKDPTAGHSADHPGATGSPACQCRRAFSVWWSGDASFSTNCTRWLCPNAAICSRSDWRGFGSLRPASELTGLLRDGRRTREGSLPGYLVPQPENGTNFADLVIADGGAESRRCHDALEPGEYLPWAGHSARHAFPQIYELIKQHKMTLVFVNTRSQAEDDLQRALAHQRGPCWPSRCIMARSTWRSGARSRMP